MRNFHDKLDKTRPFLPVRIAILTISDTRDWTMDRSGRTLEQLLTREGHSLADRKIVKDDVSEITATLENWIADFGVDAVITTGGTGLTGRDVTPEAFEQVIEKRIEGFGELFRMLSYETIGPSAIQSRAMGGLARGTYLFALPGSTGACRDAWEGILRWQLDNRYRPCNLVELMPRLQEQ